MREFLTRNSFIETVEDTQFIRLPSGNVVEVSDFVEMFGSINPTFNDLNQVGKSKGYEPLFQKWKTKGLIE